MSPEVLLAVLVVLGLILAACAVTAIVAWVIVLALRAREARLGESAGRQQSMVIADGVFELDADHSLLPDDPGRPER